MKLIEDGLLVKSFWESPSYDRATQKKFKQPSWTNAERCSVDRTGVKLALQTSTHNLPSPTQKDRATTLMVGIRRRTFS